MFFTCIIQLRLPKSLPGECEFRDKETGAQRESASPKDTRPVNDLKNSYVRCPAVLSPSLYSFPNKCPQLLNDDSHHKKVSQLNLKIRKAFGMNSEENYFHTKNLFPSYVAAAYFFIFIS